MKQKFLSDWTYARRRQTNKSMAKSRVKEIEFALKLFIAGATPNSARAITNIQKILGTYLAGRYTLNIIDVRQEPAIAKEEQIIALPLLIIKQPLPERRLVGDMSNTKKVLEGLGITVGEE
jgi:circadian clock protein KaiB